ncbi:glycerol kinase (plasmid) [Sphaerospermopsis kisseleviana NIES-73]|nr:glycerol kinase [Sphaerospermopsis kisseleviana NIES-73]
MTKYVAAIDQGTTSTRFMIFDKQGKIVDCAQKEHQQIYPQPGWVEHDPLEIWSCTQTVIKDALNKSNITVAEITAVGITNQRETIVVWNKHTGKPYYNAIVWQDTRTDYICNQLVKDLGIDYFRPITGLPIATYFSAPRIKWLLENIP